MKAPICYCGAVAVLCRGRYGRYWSCSSHDCEGVVGAHDDWRPKGTLADKVTRQARINAHTDFDALWSQLGRDKRSVAYGWLAEQLSLTPDECHMGEMNRNQCDEVVTVCRDADPQDILDWEQTDED